MALCLSRYLVRWLNSVTTTCLRIVFRLMVLYTGFVFSRIYRTWTWRSFVGTFSLDWWTAGRNRFPGASNSKDKKKHSADNNKCFLKHSCATKKFLLLLEREDSGNSNLVISGVDWIQELWDWVFLERHFSVLERILSSFLWSFSLVLNTFCRLLQKQPLLIG